MYDLFNFDCTDVATSPSPGPGQIIILCNQPENLLMIKIFDWRPTMNSVQIISDIRNSDQVSKLKEIFYHRHQYKIRVKAMINLGSCFGLTGLTPVCHHLLHRTALTFLASTEDPRPKTALFQIWTLGQCCQCILTCYKRKRTMIQCAVQSTEQNQAILLHK